MVPHDVFVNIKNKKNALMKLTLAFCKDYTHLVDGKLGLNMAVYRAKV